MVDLTVSLTAVELVGLRDVLRAVQYQPQMAGRGKRAVAKTLTAIKEIHHDHDH